MMPKIQFLPDPDCIKLSICSAWQLCNTKFPISKDLQFIGSVQIHLNSVFFLLDFRLQQFCVPQELSLSSHIFSLINNPQLLVGNFHLHIQAPHQLQLTWNQIYQSHPWLLPRFYLCQLTSFSTSMPGLASSNFCAISFWNIKTFPVKCLNPLLFYFLGWHPSCMSDMRSTL